MTTDHAEFSQWDASYVLGSLTPEDRRAYEAHLEECERCRAAVAELSSMPGLLARARPEVESWDEASRHGAARDEASRDDASAAAGPPANLVDLVTQRRLRRSRSIRNRVMLGVAGVAAAIALAIAVPAALTGPPAAGPAKIVALAPVGDSTMAVSLGLTSVDWGTRIAITCDYPPAGTWVGPYGAWAYSLVLTDAGGNTSQVSTWTAVPGKTIHLDAATAIPLDQIASIRVVSSKGATILSGSVQG